MIAALPLTLATLVSGLPFNHANPWAGVEQQSATETKLAHTGRLCYRGPSVKRKPFPRIP